MDCFVPARQSEVQRLKRLTRRFGLDSTPISSDYRVVDDVVSVPLNANGWDDVGVARRQHEAYQELLEQMVAGNPREDFGVAAAAIHATGVVAPTVVEVGCGSGYYSVVLEHLVDRPIRYVGIDSASAMIRLARSAFGARFVVGDATRLPFGSRSADIVFNGVSLMHIDNFDVAIGEAVRVSAGWCIFHTVPLLKVRPTTRLLKRAYGAETLEVIFNESELLSHLAESGLEVVAAPTSLDYDLESVLGERTITRTLVCRKAA